MRNLIKRVGIDQAVSYVLVGKGLSFITQPFILYLIATHFTSSEQGYYYTFGNILSSTIFLELGLSMVLTHYASHEYALLNWQEQGILKGETIALSRLLSLIKKSMKWYGLLSILVVILFIPIGIVFLASSTSSADVNYLMPWIILVIFSSFSLSLSPLLAILEGCGRVADIQKMKLYQISIGAIFVCIVILLKGNLFAASTLAITNFMISALWILKYYRGLIIQIRNNEYFLEGYQISWKRDIFPMQWKIGISFISGYLVSQIFTPLLFHYQNATVAGQMGMTIYVSNIILNMGMVWLLTKIPNYGALIKKGNYAKLNRIALLNTIYSLIFTVLLSFLSICIIYFIKINYTIIGVRLISLGAISALLFSNIIIIITTSMAAYLRAHKEEPLLISSIIQAVVTVIVSYISAKYYNADILAFSFTLSNLLISLPLITYIFLTKRKTWLDEKC